jgi:hypothetical protein
VTQACEHKDTKQPSKEEIENNRKLRFVYYLMELAAKDPEWKGQFNDLVQQFKESEN